MIITAITFTAYSVLSPGAQDVSPIIFILTKTLESDGDGDPCL